MQSGDELINHEETEEMEDVTAEVKTNDKTIGSDTTKKY